MVTRKERRKSGYYTPQATVSRKSLIENDLVVDTIYDDWSNFRDGCRNWFRDFKKIKKVCTKFNKQLYEKRMRMNVKQRRMVMIRKARKSPPTYTL